MKHLRKMIHLLEAEEKLSGCLLKVELKVETGNLSYESALRNGLCGMSDSLIHPSLLYACQVPCLIIISWIYASRWPILHR